LKRSWAAIALSLGGAFAFLEDDLEGLLLAQVDEVVRRRFCFGHLREIGEESLDLGEGNAGEEVLWRLVRVLL
jgi:hypothetical protein